MTDTKELRSKVIEAIKKVSDPEIPVDVWEMGLIYKCDVASNGEVYVEMTLTTPTCPEAGFLPAEVQRNIQEIPEVTKAMVEVTFDPPWDTSKMSEEARLILNMG